MTSGKNNWARIQQGIADILSVDINEIDDSVGLGTHPAWDSLNHVRVVYLLESHLNRELADDEFERCVSVQEIRKLVGHF